MRRPARRVLVMLGALVCGGLLPGDLRAEEPTPPATGSPPATGAAAPTTPPGTWNLQAKLAYAQTSGNSDTANGAAQLAYSLQETHWDVAAEGSALWAEQSGATVAAQYDAGVLARRRFGARRGLVFTENWQRSPPEGVAYRNLLGAGIDVRAIATPKWELLTELGLAWEHEQPVSGDGSDFVVGVVVLANKVQVSASTTATQKLTTYLEGGVDRRRFEGKAAVQTAITKRVALEVSYDFRYDNDPVPGAGRTDTTLNTSLVIGLGAPAASSSH